MNAKEITVLMVEPGKHPKVTTLKDDLDSLQKAVSIGADYQGLIEIVSLGNGDCIMCNEEGKLIGLEGNRRLGNDILVGVFYIMSENDEGELVSLTKQAVVTAKIPKPHLFLVRHTRFVLILVFISQFCFHMCPKLRITIQLLGHPRCRFWSIGGRAPTTCWMLMATTFNLMSILISLVRKRN